ncbi:MAG TPA: DUF3105 domain-containing protein [Herpetosiphonaceae bacterium]
MTQRTRGRRVARRPRTGLWLVLGGLGAAAALIIALVLVFGGNNPTSTASNLNGIPADAADAPQIGEQFPDTGREHIAQTERVAYSTNPPTSGNHWGNPAPWNVYADTPPADEALVHNLEHGGIIISFSKELVSADELTQLQDVYRELAAKNKRIILTSRPAMTNKVTLTAWTYRLQLDSVDLDQIRAFYNGHIARGPECQQGLCPE